MTKIAAVALKKFSFAADGLNTREVAPGDPLEVPETLHPGLSAAGLIGAPGSFKPETPVTSALTGGEGQTVVQETAEERERRLAKEAFEADAKRKAAAELAGQVEALQWNDFVAKAAEILGARARNMKKADIVAELKSLAEPPGPADADPAAQPAA